MLRKVRSIVGKEGEGLSLLAWLSAKFRYLDEEGWAEQAAAGRLLVNGRPGSAAGILHARYEVEFLVPPDSEPTVDESFRIIHEGEGFLVIDKPAGLPVHPSGRFFHSSLWRLLREKQPEIHFLNRLDRETSGLLLAATDKETARKLSALHAEGKMKKRYLAIIHGDFPEEIEASGWLLPDALSAVRKKRSFVRDLPPEADPREAQSCRTSFRALERQSGLSLVEAMLHTGRTHQIRATLLSLGFPVLGDKLYGLDEGFFIRFAEGRLDEADRAKLVLPNQALHSAFLSFPLGGEAREFSAPPPWTFPPPGIP